MKRKIDAVVKEEVQILEEEEGCADRKEGQSFEYDAPYSDSDSDSDTGPDIHFESDSDETKELRKKGTSQVRIMYQSHSVRDLSLSLKDNPEVVSLSTEILKHLKAGDNSSFSKTVKKFLENSFFMRHFIRMCESYWTYSITSCLVSEIETISKMKKSDQLTLIKGDWYVKEAIVRGGADLPVFEKNLNVDDQSIVRGAVSILITHCMGLDYIKKKVYPYVPFYGIYS